MQEIAQEYLTASERHTGKSLQQWEEIWAEKRRKGFESGELSLERVWTPYFGHIAMKKFGLLPEHVKFVDGVPIGVLERHNPGWQARAHEGSIGEDGVGMMLKPEMFPDRL